MIYVDNEGITDPRINLAIEEFVLKYMPAKDDYLLFYINEPSIIIGRNQNTIAEINSAYVEEHGIHVVRRLSGGGAVYHDPGNLNYSFVTDDDGEAFHNYARFTEPVIRALRELGVNAELTGRNDIQVGSRKISGNAQYTVKGRMYTHGTLMFHSDIDQVVSALKVNAAKIESKGIKSIRSRVANISEFLQEKMTIAEFQSYLLRSIFGKDDVPTYRLNDADWEQVRRLSRERYGNWDWNYGKSPRANVTASRRFEGIGTIELRLLVENGLIREARLFGDFFGTRDAEGLEQLLIGVPYTREAVVSALNSTDLSAYIGKATPDHIAELLFG